MIVEVRPVRLVAAQNVQHRVIFRIDTPEFKLVNIARQVRERDRACVLKTVDIVVVVINNKNFHILLALNVDVNRDNYKEREKQRSEQSHQQERFFPHPDKILA